MSFMPGGLVVLQGPSKDILMGGMVKYQVNSSSVYTGNVKQTAFALGTYFRTKDACIIMAEVEYANFTLGWSYDVNVFSALRNASSGLGGQEISLRYINPNSFRNRSSSRF